MRPGELAATAGVNLQTLRYYERRGLLPAPPRTLGGHRDYPPAALHTVRSIKTAQRLGFTLTEIAALLKTSDLQTAVRAKLSAVHTELADLSRTAATLEAALTTGCTNLETCLHTPSCPLV